MWRWKINRVFLLWGVDWDEMASQQFVSFIFSMLLNICNNSLTLTEISMSSSLRSVMYMLTVRHLSLLSSSRTNKCPARSQLSRVVPKQFLLPVSSWEAGTTNSPHQNVYISMASPSALLDIKYFLFRSETRTWRCGTITDETVRIIFDEITTERD